MAALNAYEEEFEVRATTAYFRRFGWGADEPGVVEWTEHDGKNYVVLSNVRGTLAFYRVRNDDRLQWVEREDWPQAVTT